MTAHIRQEVNFLQNLNVDITPKLSFSIAIVTSLVFLGGLMALLLQNHQQLKDVKADIVDIEKNNMFQQANMVNAGGITQYQSQLKAVEKQLLKKYQLWANYQQITVSGKQGFSEHFYHIANLATKDLSLYEIDIYNKGKNLALKGYARQAEDIPIYINSLKQQQEFEEIVFGDLSIEKLDDHDVLRFSLEKIEEEKEIFDNGLDENGNVNDLMNMPLVNKLDLSDLIKQTTIDQGNSQL